MQTTRPSLNRMRSSRHFKKVSCETLSLSNVDLHSNPQLETQSFYYSDDEKDHMKEDEATELESSRYVSLADDYLQQVRALEKHSGTLHNPSYGDGKAAGNNLFARFLSKVSHITAASRAKEVERARSHVQAYPTVIRRPCGVLPQTAPILLHIGSHSGPPNSKAPTTLRASSIFLGNAVAVKMNPSGAGEPSSPKVTCLGTVRNKQKNIGSHTLRTSKEDRGVDVGCPFMLVRKEKKKAGMEVAESARKTEKKASRMGSGNAMERNHTVEKIKETDSEKALKKLTAQESAVRCTMSGRFATKDDTKKWSWGETMRHEEHKVQNWQATEASALGASSREISVDLSRFGSESQGGHELDPVTSSVGVNDSQRFEKDKEDSEHAPPQNALVLIRSRKAKDNPEVASSSVAAALGNEQETSFPTIIDDHVMNKFTSTQFHMPTSTLLPLLEVEMKKAVTIADILGHTSSVMTENAFSMACNSKLFHDKFSLQTEHSAVHRQPKPSLESSIWQRRAIEKPCALDIKRPMRAEIYQRTTT